MGQGTFSLKTHKTGGKTKSDCKLCGPSLIKHLVKTWYSRPMNQKLQYSIVGFGLVAQSVVTWQRNSYRIDWSELVLQNSLMLQKKLQLQLPLLTAFYTSLHFTYYTTHEKNTNTHRKSTSASVSRSSVLTSQYELFFRARRSTINCKPSSL